MSYYVILRGPLGVGKTTVSRRLAEQIGAEYISIDRILDDEGLWVEGKLSEFVGANRFAAQRARSRLAEGKPVIFDGNFYWRTQIQDLVGRLKYPHYVFTLKAPLAVCVARDDGRVPTHGADAARAVYAKSTRFDLGVGLDATRPVARLVREITSHIRAHPPRRAR